MRQSLDRLAPGAVSMQSFSLLPCHVPHTFPHVYISYLGCQHEPAEWVVQRVLCGRPPAKPCATPGHPCAAPGPLPPPPPPPLRCRGRPIAVKMLRGPGQGTASAAAAASADIGSRPSEGRGHVGGG